MKAWMSLLDRSTFGLGRTHPVLFFTLYLIVLIGCSLLIHRWIEEPARRYLRVRLSGAHVPADHAVTEQSDASGLVVDSRGRAAAA